MTVELEHLGADLIHYATDLNQKFLHCTNDETLSGEKYMVLGKL